MSDLPEGFEPTTPTGLPSINKPTTPTLPEGFEPTPASSSSDILTPRGKKIASSLYTPTLKYGGMMAGGALAAPEAAAVAAGTGGAALPASVALEAGGGAAGYAVGASLSDKLDQLIGLAPPPKNVSDIVGKTATDLKEGIEQEIGGRILAKPIEAGLNGVGNILATGAKKSADIVTALTQKAKALGIDLSPAELVGSKALGTVEHVLDNIPWTADILKRYRLEQMQQLNTVRDNLIADSGSESDIEDAGLKIKNMADSFVQKMQLKDKTAMTAMKNRLLEKMGIRTSYEDLDISAKQAVQQYQADLSDQIASAYKSVGEKMVDTKIVPENTLEAARNIISEQERVAPSARNSDVLRAAQFLSKTSDDVPEEVAQIYATANPAIKTQLEAQFPELLNPELEKSYADLAANVKAFNVKKYSQIDTAHGTYQITPAGHAWDELIDALHSDMKDVVAGSENTDLIQAHEIANNLYKKRLALFDDPAFKMINDKYPGAVAESILKSGNTDLISRYHALTGDTLFNKAKAKLTTSLLSLDSGDALTGDQIRKAVLNLGDSARSIYSSKELSYFKNLADAVDIRPGVTNDLLKNPLLKTMVSNRAETVPAGIAKALVRPNNSGSAAALEHFMGSEAKKTVANAFLPQLLSVNQHGDFLPQTFAKTYDTYGYKTIEAWYGKETANTLKNLADIGRRMQGVQSLSSNANSPGRFLIGFYEGTRVLGKMESAVTSGFSPKAVLSLGKEASVILSTRQLAKLYTAPEGRNLFIHGLITPKTSEEAAKTSGKILAILGNEILRSKKQ